MVFQLWEAVFGYLKGRPYWSRLQPLFLLATFYVASAVLGYYYIEWQYRISPKLPLYLNSYIFKQITLVFVALGIIVFIFRRRDKRASKVRQEKPGQVGLEQRGKVFPRAIIAGVCLVVTVPFFLYLSPSDASHIRIKFMEEPRGDFDKYAFVYLVYELNKLQKDWYFQVDFKVFDDGVLTSRQRKSCTMQSKSLCFAEVLANDQPLIGITTRDLDDDSFWQNRDKVSVISTFRWQRYAPPSTYEYLIYSVVVQSMLIHLNAQCEGVPKDAFKVSRVAYGDLFHFSPRRKAMKSAILASHLSPDGERLLLNCFGAEYMGVSSRLLTLDWLHSQKIAENLEKVYGVKF